MPLTAPARTVLKLRYDGTGFSGFQSQPGQRTVQGTVEQALAEVFGNPVRIRAAGRTDAGVHAVAMHALVEHDGRLTDESVRRAVNAHLPPDLEAAAACAAPDGFDPRRSARGKRYAYLVDRSGGRDPLLARYSARLSPRADLELIRRAMPDFVVRADFSSFRASGCASKNPVREIRRFSLLPAGPERWLFVIEGSAFLKQMVRNIVGTLFEVGAGRIEPESIQDIIAARDRTAAGPTAPAAGLCLMGSWYPDLGIEPERFLPLTGPLDLSLDP